MAIPFPRPLRIIVVDDERSVADSLAEILQDRGYEVFVCYDPTLAITAGDKLRPHVLISDIVMPHMNGFELARHFAQHHPQCKVLLLSGNASSASLAHDAEAAGPVPHCLDKPVHPSRILSFLESCVTPS